MLLKRSVFPEWAKQINAPSTTPKGRWACLRFWLPRHKSKHTSVMNRRPVSVFAQLCNLISRATLWIILSIRKIILNLIKSTGKCARVAFSGTACNLWGSGSLLASFLRNLPRKGLEGVAERAFRGRLRADAVYDAAAVDSISRSLKRYGLILLLWFTIDSFAVAGCGIDNIKRLLASLSFHFA